MDLDRKQFLDQGYVILRGMIPADRLEEMRQSFEQLVDRQRVIWRRDRKVGDPPGGLWEIHPHPRLQFSGLIDKPTANTVEFCLHETTLEVSRRLMGSPEAAVTNMALMCNPVRDHGPKHWHRDIGPGIPAPLTGLLDVLREHGPQYVQWNIALYDDKVLWVIPGSHRRLNTEPEDRQLAADPRIPLPGGIPVELHAGDGVAYALPILHWGSRYAPTHRRTIHLGYRSFGSPAFSYVHWRHWEPVFFDYLSPAARDRFEHTLDLWRREHELIETIFRATIDRDRARFDQALARLHPAPGGRMVSVVMLSKLARKLRAFKQLDLRGLTREQREHKAIEHWGYGTLLFDPLAERFSPREAEALWQRFAPLDAALGLPAAPSAPALPGALRGATTGAPAYEPNRMPDGLDLETFVASWEPAGKAVASR